MNKIVAMAIVFTAGVMLTMTTFPATAQSVDIHQINAQIFGNENATNGIPSYLTAQSPAGVVPSSLIITARSPGNSTLSLAVAGAYVDDIQGVPVHNLLFRNITTLFFFASVANDSFVITIHSYALNFTRVFHYTGIVYTPQQFINYETAKKMSAPLLGIPLAVAWLMFAPATAAGVYTAYEVAFFTAKWRRSHPNLSDKVIGGVGNEK